LVTAGSSNSAFSRCAVGGYRFVGAVEERTAASTPPRTASHQGLTAIDPPATLVGRDTELAQLYQRYAAACQGRRQVVFVTGEVGIGKTTLVDTFVTQVAASTDLWVGRGQCIEHHGSGEAYLPLLEALSQLGRSSTGGALLPLLHQHAPNWLLHLPTLVPVAEREALQRRVGDATRTRMLRELAEAVEALTTVRPLVLVLEDLHWSDGATLDWLAYVARRREAARLLVLGTYRPAEAAVHANSVRDVTRDLQMHGQCAEVALTYLSEEAVSAYLAQRFPRLGLPEECARVLYHRTNGNPLFLVTMVDALVQQGMLRVGASGWECVGEVATLAAHIPETLRQLLERQLGRLTMVEQMLLEAASVAGVEFAVAAVATAVSGTLEDVEERCVALARRGQFIRVCGTDVWPDGTVAARYGFLHALYRETLYERVPAGRRVRWHQQIGHRLEAGYDPQARERATELAEHFVRGRDPVRAVKYLHYAGEQAGQRLAYEEALQHLTRGLALLAMLPETPARLQQEIDLQLALGPVLSATKGPAAPEVEQTYIRALALCQQAGETPQRFPALLGLLGFYQNGGALLTARELGEQLYRLAQREAMPTYLLEAHEALGGTLFYLGDYAAAWRHLEQGIALSDPVAQQALALRRGLASGMGCLVHAALTLWCLGYPAQAVRRCQEALALAQTLAHSYSLAVAQHFALLLYHRRREASTIQTQADALLTLATGQGFPLFVAVGIGWQGLVLAMQGRGAAGLAQMHQGMAAVLATQQALSQPVCLVLLAEAAGHAGQVEEGLRLLTEALAALAASGRGDLLAEAYRLQGEFLLRQVVPDVARAEASFQRALTIARRQQAKSWELRAAISLARLWQQHGKHAEASALLTPIYGWFTEGFDTPDLQEARTLLARLEGGAGHDLSR
jgi:predicted ATPase